MVIFVIHLFICSFLSSFSSFLPWFLGSLVPLFLCSFVPFFICLFIYLFICSFVQQNKQNKKQNKYQDNDEKYTMTSLYVHPNADRDNVDKSIRMAVGDDCIICNIQSNNILIKYLKCKHQSLLQLLKISGHLKRCNSLVDLLFSFLFLCFFCFLLVCLLI